MTAQAERIKESHRGWRRAEPASRSRLAALDTFRLRYERIDDFNVCVEDKYLLNLAISYWRALDGSSHGYLISALDAEIRRHRNPEKPVAGRDIADAPSKPTGQRTVDESAAGAISFDFDHGGTASRLPVVTP